MQNTYNICIINICLNTRVYELFEAKYLFQFYLLWNRIFSRRCKASAAQIFAIRQ